MKFDYKTFFSALLAISVSVSAAAAAETALIELYADSENAGSDSSDAEFDIVELKTEYFTLEYSEITYSGSANKPAITAKIGGSELAENTDFIAEYPEDSVSAGEKTVIVSGIGAYSGSVELSYTVNPYNGLNAGVTAAVEPCVYDGSAKCPKALVVFGDSVLKEGRDFTAEYANNVNATTASDKAKCILTFMGNFSGTRTVMFDITKASSENYEITFKANRGINTVFDLSPLKPSGALFGTPTYNSADFDPTNKPKIAFNELRFALNSSFRGSTDIRVPVKNLRNYADYELVFTVTAVEKGVPMTVIKKISKTYDGTPITAEALANNGSYGELDGQRIDGSWELLDEPPSLPCDTAVRVRFTPYDQTLEPAVGIAAVSISKLWASGFSVSAPSRAERGGSVSVEISGVPEDYTGEILLKSSKDGAEGFSLTKSSDTEYTAVFPDADMLCTFSAELAGDKIYAAKAAEFTVRVGNAELPEEQIPAKVTTDEELAEMAESAENGAEIFAEGCKSIPAEIVKTAAEKDLTFCVKLNDTYTWKIKASLLSKQDTLNLALTPAVIPYKLTERVGGDTSASFTVAAKNLGGGASIEVTAAKYGDDKPRYANLFLYNTNGELSFVSCNLTDKNGKSELRISQNGKYVVISDFETKMPGDLDNNMAVNAHDATEVLKITAGITEEKNSKADVDNNGIINAHDAAEILKKAAGMKNVIDN